MNSISKQHNDTKPELKQNIEAKLNVFNYKGYNFTKVKSFTYMVIRRIFK